MGDNCDGNEQSCVQTDYRWLDPWYGECTYGKCCGDDSGEHYKISKIYQSDGSYGDLTAEACCSANNKCVDKNGNCKSEGTYGDAGDMNATPKPNTDLEYCTHSGAGITAWFDQDSGSSYCTGAGNTWMTGGCEAMQRWGDSGLDGCDDFNYDSTFCCGDDDYEYYTTQVFDSSMDGSINSDAKACCGHSDSCINKANTCYPSSPDFPYDVDEDGDSDVCSNGEWIDCNDNSNCPDGYECQSNDCVEVGGNHAPTIDPTSLNQKKGGVSIAHPRGKVLEGSTVTLEAKVSDSDTGDNLTSTFYIKRNGVDVTDPPAEIHTNNVAGGTWYTISVDYTVSQTGTYTWKVQVCDQGGKCSDKIGM